jgi:type I restriction enzyme S subunit
MSYELIPLGELGEIVAGSTPDTNNQKYWGGDIAWITPADLTNHEGIYFTGELRKITEAGYKSCSTKMLPADSILFSSRAPIGHCAVTSFPLCTNQGFKSIIPNEKLDSVYGFFALKFFTPQIEALGRGATFAEVNKEIFENIKIPLPPLTEQKRIASLLARADRLRQLRCTARDLGDALLQSVFLEMFGDPVRNEKGWEEQNLNELCRNITDGTHDTPERTEIGVPFITSKNIRPYEIDLSVLEYVSKETHQEILKRTNPQYGDVIYTNIGVNLGNAAMNKLPFSFSLKNVALLQPNSEVLNSYYLEALLNNERFKENLIYLSSAGGAQKFITLEVLRTILIPYPPLSKQEEFAGVVARVESLRGRMGESTRQVEGLFESLLNQSFGG